MKWLLLGMAMVVILSAGVLVVLESPAWLPDGLSRRQDDRVLVFLVGGSEGVDRVRRAVDPARVVYADEQSVALVEGRIVAASVAAVSLPMNAVGWRDRSIEIFHVERAERKTSPGREGTTDVDPERMAKLRALVKKPTLTYGEQVFVLQAMNDGIEF